MGEAGAAITPDTKDWTWVIGRRCPDCGLDASTVDYVRIPESIRTAAAGFGAVLARPDAARRPDPHTWSPVEYAAHVRDVCAVFADRLASMLTQDGPRFSEWSGDDAAVQQAYAEQDPGQVATALVAQANRVADAFAAVPVGDRARTGRRGDGMEFTVDSLARYLVHEPVHHLWDVRG
ncbi:DinB family protein [Speluncibacter jeojiensis]|uniref:DinB family protein n=1 Tax=Speluncibacter jeojiensis TaxID=2710754 RepID=A0A9X4LVX7_9ACTN|nr:DinB family protein [Corynebacteriales bacterium D3-21]